MNSDPASKSAVGSPVKPEDTDVGALPEVDLKHLLGDATQLVIRHGDQRYVLRLTRQNKLILTK